MTNYVHVFMDRIINYPDLRVGQNLFNALYEVKPDFADSIRGTNLDMYYLSDEDFEKKFDAMSVELLNAYVAFLEKKNA